jgi:AraC-like DNA-binding protein
MAMSEPVSVAQYFPWEGGAVFVGTAGEFPVHAHQAIQICFLFEGRIQLRARNEDAWTDYELAIVPSHQAHGMNGARVHHGATLFVEPETREGRSLTERYLQNGTTDLGRMHVAPMLLELREASLERRGRRAIVERARRIVQELAQAAEPALASDERILRAVKYVNEHLSAPITLKQVAGVAYLSPSRFRHLFAEEVGMGLRQYVLWRRFVSVWERRMNGESLSAAAHSAGFADSAHLARTCRRMFEIPPSLMDISRDMRPASPAVSQSVAPKQ